jgi:hypothetical protein
MPTLIATTSTAAISPFALHWSLYPKTYIAPRIPSGIHTINGDLTKDAWSKAPWSDEFDDIRGAADAPPSERPPPSCSTRVKLLWDDDHLYIGALITSNMTVEAHFTKENSPIFQKDSDFECFLDPVGSNWNYKEWEGNALNTVWNLMLDRPYSDGGSEHSGRVAKPGEENYYAVKHQKTATRILEGTVNNVEGTKTVWSVEIAMAHSDVLAAHVNNGMLPPSIGTMWRINFSRVEKRGDVNWTWQAQIAWDAAGRRFAGNVNMHLPDAWGYLVFGQETIKDTQEIPRDASWPARLAAMNVYYAQQEYRRETGVYATEINQLTRLLNQAIVSPFQIEIQSISESSLDAKEANTEFIVVVKGNPDGAVVTVTDKRLLQVHPSTSAGALNT